MLRYWKAGALAAALALFASTGVWASDITPPAISAVIIDTSVLGTGVGAGIVVDGNDVIYIDGSLQVVTLGSGDKIVPTGAIGITGSNSAAGTVGVLSNNGTLVLDMGSYDIGVDGQTGNQIMAGYLYSGTGTVNPFTGSISVADVLVGQNDAFGQAAGLAFVQGLGTGSEAGVDINGAITADDILVTSGAGAGAFGIMGGGLGTNGSISFDSIAVNSAANTSGGATGRVIGLRLEGVVSGTITSTGGITATSGDADTLAGEALGLYLNGIANGGSVTIGGDITATAGTSSAVGAATGTYATGVRVTNDIAGTLSTGAITANASAADTGHAYGLRAGNITSTAKVTLGTITVNSGAGHDGIGVFVTGDVAANTLALTGNIAVSGAANAYGLQAGSFAGQTIGVDIDATGGVAATGYAVATTDTTKNSVITIVSSASTADPRIVGQEGSFNLAGTNDTLNINAEGYSNSGAAFGVFGAENINFNANAEFIDGGSYITFDQATGANAITVASGMEVVLPGNITATLGDWNKNGAGILALDGLTGTKGSTAAGNINVNAGTLLLANNYGLTATGGSINVAGGATLATLVDDSGTSTYGATLNSNAVFANNATIVFGTSDAGANAIAALNSAASANVITVNDGTVLKLAVGVTAATDVVVIANDDIANFQVAGNSTTEVVEAFLARNSVGGLYRAITYGINGNDIVVSAGTKTRAEAVDSVRILMGLAGLGDMTRYTDPLAGNWFDIVEDLNLAAQIDPDAPTSYQIIDRTNPRAWEIANLVNDLTENPGMFTRSGAEAATSVLTGLDLAKSINVATNTARRVNGTIFKRILRENDMRAAVSQQHGASDAYATYVMNSNFANRFWVGGLGIWEDGDRYKGNAGYDYDAYGLQLGYDHVFGPVTVGASFAYTKGDYDDLAALSNDSEIENYSFNLYATYHHCSGFFASVIGGYTHSEFDMNQRFAVGMWDRSDYDADTWSIGATLGYDWRPTNQFTLTPSIGIYYYDAQTDDFSSTYRRNLKVKQDFAEMPIGLNLRYDIPVGDCGNVFSIEANGGYAYRFSDDGGRLGSFRYDGINSVLDPADVKSPRNYWNVGVGVTYNANRWDFGVKYDYYTSKSSDAHGLRAQVGFKF